MASLRVRLSLSTALCVVAAAAAHAQEAGAEPAAGPPVQETVVREDAAPADGTAGRARSIVRRGDFERRLPRSSPDALRYEPGVFVQQSAHAQGSPYVRGLTGQQTLILFDGIRLNNSTFRQGPNQYFFTLDAASLESIEVLRGGASTRYGSDALGGVLLTLPLEPTASDRTRVRPTLALKGATADRERGGRLQADATGPAGLSFVGGVGGRRVGLLESGGPVPGTGGAGGASPEVPRFAPDGRTQLGTGFDELTADARLVWRPTGADRATLATYVYRQHDAPRTDQCPPPGARFDECLRYERQLRTLIYGAWEHAPAEAPRLARVRSTVSWQHQHERRRAERPASFVINRGTDDVRTLGASLVGEGRPLQTRAGPLAVAVGAEAYFDMLRSAAEIAFTDIDVVVPRSRGQYLDGATYVNAGAFGLGALEVTEALQLRGGTRLGGVQARAPEDPASGSAAVARTWLPASAFAGAQWAAARGVTLLANLDRSFRAPNLDDLTSRQQTGPGFQFENAALGPETALTAELGARAVHPVVSVDAWVFQSWVQGAIGRRQREAGDCPPNTPQCGASHARFQLVNAEGVSFVRGAELTARARLPRGFTARGAVAWTWGEGPNLTPRPDDAGVPWEARVPLSRIPPLHGNGEFGWLGKGFSFGLGARWAGAQRRLAVADLSDARIPEGGTPGFVVVDARASWQPDDRWRLALVAENLFDAPYRYHGSSVNGPARGLVAALEVSPF